MVVDRRLENYWTNVRLWHKTADPVWVSLIDVMAMTDEGPAGRAAQRFTLAHNKEVLSDTS